MTITIKTICEKCNCDISEHEITNDNSNNKVRTRIKCTACDCERVISQ